jgi:mono/diheme cytochrome c family protein
VAAAGIICRRVISLSSRRRFPASRCKVAALVAIGAAVVASGCGGKITVTKTDTSVRRGAEIFYERCSGCHSISAANAYGSKPAGQLEPGERTNGPDFNVRRVRRDDVLFAIRNGGFSGQIMPANIVVGRDAELVADFLATCSGRRNRSICEAEK